MTSYEKEGFESREEYLKSLSEDYGISYIEVKLLSDLLGPSEDFDGLINALEDYESFKGWVFYDTISVYRVWYSKCNFNYNTSYTNNYVKEKIDK